FVGQTSCRRLLSQRVFPLLLGLLNFLRPRAVNGRFWLAILDGVYDGAESDLGVRLNGQLSRIVAAEFIGIGVDLNDLRVLWNDLVPEAHGRAFAEGRPQGEN